MRKLGKLLALLVVNIVLAVGGSEAILRCYQTFFNPSFLVFQETPYLQPSALPGVPYEIRPNAVLTGASRFNTGVTVRFNECGFRGDDAVCDMAMGRRAPARPLIAVIGDSYTVGSSLHDADTYPAIMEQALRAQGIPATVLNFGAGAGNSKSELGWLRHKVLELPATPDVVVWQFLLNDFFREGGLEWGVWGNWAFRHFYTWRLATQTFNRNTIYPRSYADLRRFIITAFNDPETWNDTIGAVCEAAELLAARNIPAVFLYPPYHEMLSDWGDYTEEVRALDQRIMTAARNCGWREIAYPAPELQQHPFRSVILDFELDHHPNAEGARIIGTAAAQAVARVLKQ